MNKPASVPWNEVKKISRIERGQQDTSIAFLNRVAKGLDKKLHVSFG